MIISLSGKMGSGKNTTANVIQYIIDSKESGFTLSESNYNDYIKNKHYLKCKFEQKSFAGKLKQIASMLTGATLEQLEDQDFKKLDIGPDWGMTYRELLQKLGTEAMRNGLHENVWVNALFADYKETIIRSAVPVRAAGFIDHHVYPNWIITDMRFPNEMDSVKAKGGITIRVNRPKAKISTGDSVTDFVLNETKNFGIVEHASETALDNHNFDYIIENNSSIEDLISKVRQILVSSNIL